MAAQTLSTPLETPVSQPKNQPRSTLVSRNVTISGHRTSIRLEPDMWSGLKEICRRERATLHEICTLVAGRKEDKTSLTAAIRVFVMSYYRAAATEEGHIKAGHGYGVGVTGTALVHALPNGGSVTAPTATPRFSGGYMGNGSRGDIR
ncbi:MAG: ribbon-helix-helix domain-containing protein [Alphaproteobacteria bacterium]|nr:ribbon-helix-helix domain-containing protein [Alphaproteobacteria bacterium]